MRNESNILPVFNNPIIRFVAGRQYRWLRHTLFIMVALLLAFKGDFSVTNDPRSPKLLRAIIITDAITFVFIMGIIYFMILVLIPRLLYRSRVFLFAVSFFMLLVIIYLAVWFVDIRLLQPAETGRSNLQHIELSFLHFVQIAAVGGVLLGSVVGMVIFKKWINDVQRMHQLQEMNLRTELEQLKSQVNPHFLFNTLNNLIVLVKTDANKAEQVLFGLSDLLRYQLYDSAKEKKSLVQDIDFIRNLLALEKIRKNDFAFMIHTEGNIKKISLPPFLFIPFVENAIKHGASTVGHSYLDVKFVVEGNKLFFRAENSKPVVKQTMIGGLGLKNIRRRLELLYPGTHSLIITDEKDKYILNLILPL